MHSLSHVGGFGTLHLLKKKAEKREDFLLMHSHVFGTQLTGDNQALNNSLNYTLVLCPTRCATQFEQVRVVRFWEIRSQPVMLPPRQAEYITPAKLELRITTTP